MGKRWANAASVVHLAEAGYTISPVIESEREQSWRRKIRPQSDGQRRLMAAIADHNLTLALGPAGTGKTYLAVSAAVDALTSGAVARIVLTRPAVEAGESLGYLPGDINAKLAPYLRPLDDALNERLGGKRLKQLIGERAIEIAPIAYMRGRTLEQRLYRHRRGAELHLRPDQDAADPARRQRAHGGDRRPRSERPARRPLRSRRDRPPARRDREVAVVRLDDADIVRHPLVAEMLTVL